MSAETQALVETWQEELDSNPHPFVQLTVSHHGWAPDVVWLKARTFAKNQEVHANIHADFREATNAEVRRLIVNKTLQSLLGEVYS